MPYSKVFHSLGSRLLLDKDGGDDLGLAGLGGSRGHSPGTFEPESALKELAPVTMVSGDALATPGHPGRTAGTR